MSTLHAIAINLPDEDDERPHTSARNRALARAGAISRSTLYDEGSPQDIITDVLHLIDQQHGLDAALEYLDSARFVFEGERTDYLTEQEEPA